MNHTMSTGLINQLVEASASATPITMPMFESYPGLMSAFPKNQRQNNANGSHFQDTGKHPGGVCDPRIQVPASLAGVSNCYIFKSRLQEYAQKVGLSTPVYETFREGPSHEPSFRSTVVVGGCRYDSLLGFTNRKAAEQSAAEVALMDLSKSGDKKESISVPVHETGLCKNLLQEYAQKMNYAIPTYTCQNDDTVGRTPFFSCTVDIGGIQYIGATARTKKEAEIKAARTALLAIQSSGSIGGELGGKIHYTVVPCKRKVPETTGPQPSTKKAKKTKKPRLRKKALKKKPPGSVVSQPEAGSTTILANNLSAAVSDQQHQEGLSDVQVPDNGQLPHSLQCLPQVNDSMNINQSNGQASAEKGCVDPQVILKIDGNQLTSTDNLQGVVNTGTSGSTMPVAVASNSDGIPDATPKINVPAPVQLEVSLPDSETNPKSEVPTMTHTDQAGNGTSDQGPDGIVSNQPNAIPDDSTVPREPTPAVADHGIQGSGSTTISDAVPSEK